MYEYVETTRKPKTGLKLKTTFRGMNGQNGRDDQKTQDGIETAFRFRANFSWIVVETTRKPKTGLKPFTRCPTTTPADVETTRKPKTGLKHVDYFII